MGGGEGREVGKGEISWRPFRVGSTPPVGSERRGKWVAFVGEVAMIRSSSIENEDRYDDVVGRHGGGEEVSRGGGNN